METGEPKLKGTLVKKAAQEGTKTVTEISAGLNLIQRDGRAEFVVEKINNTDRGQRAVLRSVVGNSTITLGVDDLLEKLNTSGSAWELKK